MAWKNPGARLSTYDQFLLFHGWNGDNGRRVGHPISNDDNVSVDGHPYVTFLPGEAQRKIDRIHHPCSWLCGRRWEGGYCLSAAPTAFARLICDGVWRGLDTCACEYELR